MSSSSPADAPDLVSPAPAARHGLPSAALSDPPPAGAALLRDALPAVAAYGELLATDGVVRGVIGPREAPRLWDRHLLNSALLCDLVPDGVTVVDVGSGGGLPGVVVALARPDLTVTLVDSMLRRTTFLTEVVERLGISDRVTVTRGRAEELRGVRGDVVVARAVADLGTLARWTARLCRRDGLLLVLRGDGAAQELVDHAAALRRTGWTQASIIDREAPGVTPTRVVRAVRA